MVQNKFKHDKAADDRAAVKDALASFALLVLLGIGFLIFGELFV